MVLQVIAGILLTVFIGGILFFLFNQSLYLAESSLTASYPTEMADPGVAALSNAWNFLPGFILLVIIIAAASEGTRRRLFSLSLIGMLILGGLGPFAAPVAYADGSVTAQEVMISWRYASNLGMATTAGSGSTLEDSTWMNVFNVTGTAIDVDYDSLRIYSMYGYIHSDDSDDREVRAYAYEWLSDTNAGAQLGESIEAWPESPAGSYSWKGGGLTTELDVGSARIFFYGLYAVAEGGSYTLAHPSAGGRYVFRAAIADDPFTESSSGADAYSIVFRVRGYENKSSTYNLYVGDADNYTARYDMNYTAPVGAALRQMQITLPVGEYLVNITRSNGGAWDEVLSSSDYSESVFNGTHNVITLPEATIGLYGWDYRVYSSSHAYLYTFTGLFYENGTNAGGVNITTTFTTGEEIFEVNNSASPVTRGWDSEVVSFSWALVGGGTRVYHPRDNSEEIMLFTPEDSYSTYEIDLIDYTSKVGPSNTYLDAIRYVNGSQHIIERKRVQNVLTDVALLMVIGKAYSFRVLFYDDTQLSFAYFVPGLDQNPILLLQATFFSDQIHASQQDILFEVSRSPGGTTIQGEYLDEGNLTTYVIFEVQYYNYTVAYDSDAADSSDVLFQWNGANNVTNYRVMMRSMTPSSYHGNVTYYFNLPGLTTGVSYPIDLSLMGNLTDTEGQVLNITPYFFAFINLALAFSFSWVNIVAGGFITVLMAALQLRMGWMDWSSSLLTAAMCFVLMLGIVVAKWRMKGR